MVMTYKENKTTTPGDKNDIKITILPYVKFISLLFTIILTLIITNMSNFEYWHLASIWGGGGLTTIIIWKHTQTPISSEEMKLKYENRRALYAMLEQLAIPVFVIILVGGLMMMPLILANPDIVDKFFDFILELVK